MKNGTLQTILKWKIIEIHSVPVTIYSFSKRNDNEQQ